MTSEKAIKIIDEWCDNGTHDFIHEALVMAKDALKAQSGKDINVRGKDTVYRQDAIDALGEEPPVWYDGEGEIAERDQWRRDVEALKQLPPAELKSEPGHWLIVTGERHMRWRKCPECGSAYDVMYKHNFCPSCGADLRGADIYVKD